MKVVTQHSSGQLSTHERMMLQIERYKLANGLRVWTQARPGTGTVALALQVAVGSRYESKHNNGISHFVEHMLFTGTERWSEPEIMDVIRQRGGQANAVTGVEDTVIYVHVDSEHLSVALEWLYQVVYRPTFPAEKVDKERMVIINEKGGEYDRLRRFYDWIEDQNFGWDVRRAVKQRLFPQSSLLLPVIGSDASLKAIDRTALLQHYQQYYLPANMSLIAVGDFAKDQLNQLMGEIFGRVGDDFAVPEQQPVTFVPAHFNVSLKGPAPNEQGQLLVGAPLGPENHPDRYAWWVLAELLERAIMREIRYNRGLTYDVSVFTELHPEGGYLGVYIRTAVDNFPEIQALIADELARFQSGEFVAGELDEIKTVMRGRVLLNLQSNVDLMWWHAVDALMVGLNEPIPDYFAGILAVDEQAIQRIVAGYFRPERQFTVIHNPIVTPGRLRPWVAASMATVSTAVLAWHIRNKGRRH